VPVEKIVVKKVPRVVEVEKIIFPRSSLSLDSADSRSLARSGLFGRTALKEKADCDRCHRGHTDTVGNGDYNQRLGQRRAETVMSELSAQGIDRGRMSAASLGRASL